MGRITLTEALLCGAVASAVALTAPFAAAQALDRAKVTACADKLRRIGAAETAYAGDNKGYLAMGEKNFLREGGMARCGTFSMGMPPMLLLKTGYLKDAEKPAETIAAARERCFRCPEDEVNFVASPITGWSRPLPNISYVFCWFDTQKALKAYSYPHKTKPDQPDTFGLRANIDRDDPGRYIFADLIHATSERMAMVPKDKAKANHEGLFNSLYLGGYVGTKEITPAQEKFVQGGVNRFANLADEAD